LVHCPANPKVAQSRSGEILLDVACFGFRLKGFRTLMLADLVQILSKKL